ncbi:NINE protein [Raineya orbicola]|jgi:TM2 domain-containing membrane protein YozV|nr:NINE protein [Raineya orbicola]
MKKRLIAAAMSLFGGTWGVHHFYLGNFGKGVLSVIFSWTGIPTIIGLVDAVKFLTMTDEQFDVKYNFEEYKKKIIEEEFRKNLFHKDIGSELEKLAQLMEKGYITFEEFERRKAKLLQ